MLLVAPGRQRDRDWEAGYQSGGVAAPSTKGNTNMKSVLSLLVLGSVFGLQPAMAQDGEALFRSKPCVGCHMVDSKLVGPAFTDVAAKVCRAEGRRHPAGRSHQEWHPGHLGCRAHAGQRRHGRRGQDLAEWVLSQKK